MLSKPTNTSFKTMLEMRAGQAFETIRKMIETTQTNSSANPGETCGFNWLTNTEPMSSLRIVCYCTHSAIHDNGQICTKMYAIVKTLVEIDAAYQTHLTADFIRFMENALKNPADVDGSVFDVHNGSVQMTPRELHTLDANGAFEAHIANEIRGFLEKLDDSELDQMYCMTIIKDKVVFEEFKE